MKKIALYCTTIFLLCFTTTTGLAAFSDVPTNHPYSVDIKYLEEKGVVKEDELTFRPDEPVTREVFAKWILKNAGLNAEQYQPKTRRRFFDVPWKMNPYAPYIYKLVDIGAVSFPDDPIAYFNPQKPLSKKEALQWLFFVQGVPVPKLIDERSFGATDVKPEARVAPLIDKAIKIGALRPGRVAPFRKLTRGQASHFLRTASEITPTLTVTIVPSGDSDIARNPKYDLLVGTWNKIFQSYLKRDTVNRDHLMYGAIEGMVKELGDKYSDFERPGDNALLDSLSGEVEGIGAVIQLTEGEVVVVSPIADSPAERAGILPNDVILEVDGVSVKGMKLSEVTARIKGPRGTDVKLTIRRDSATLSYTITRELVKIISAKVSYTPDMIAKIRLSSFGDNTSAEFRAIADDILEKKPKGIILDLRTNPGGFLHTAIEVAGYFIPKGETVATVAYPDRREAQLSTGKAQLKTFPLIVLTNSGSASASEILAGALQDFGVGRVVGEKTFGKGTVQELSDFTDGSTLKLTVAEWLTATGRSFEKNGIAPDIEIEMTDEDRKAGRDPQMERALAELRK